ncbi:MAG: peptidoglycan DD-metalloendopeptidase family protein [Actinomycetota bacterium]|nr:peptidoglycan DD-metalloendopeptidase family protein [Actinomycetota bacterium]
MKQPLRNKRRRPRVVAAVTVALLGCLAAVALPAAADPHSRLERIHERQSKVHDRSVRAAARGDSVAGLLAKLDADRERTRRKVAALDEKIAGLDAHIDQVRARLAEAQQEMARLTLRLQNVLARLERQRDNFVARAVAAYEAGPNAEVNGLLSSETFADLIQRTTYFDSAASANARLIEDIDQLSNKLDAQRALVEHKESVIADSKLRLEGAKADLVAIRNQRTQELAARDALIQKKHDLLQNIRAHVDRLRRAEAELEQQSQRFEALLQGDSASAPTAGNGTFIWPVVGPITSPFGWRINPITHSRELHPGMDIGVGYGTPIHAAGDGVVVFAGYANGYGNYTLIDHGGSLATGYGHQSEIDVSVGDVVTTGQVIGLVGCTGLCTGPHLHFEVRVNGSPVDPMPYL